VGLRGRLTAALFAMSVLALAIAAVSLLLPLDALLRRDALSSLSAEARTAKAALDALPATALRPRSLRLQSAARTVARRTAADVVIADQSGHVLARAGGPRREQLREIARAIREDRIVKNAADHGDDVEAQVAVPLDAGQIRVGLGLRKSFSDLGAAQRVVGRGLLVAALIALVAALAVGAALGRRLSRRLAALRDTSLRLAGLGPVVEIQDDGARDEVGDLTRAFASMQQQLREQEQARRTFVATASHELRTPLTSLRLLLQSATEQLATPQPDLDDTRDQLARAVRQSDRLSKLATELLDLSRLDAGVPLLVERLELAEIARAVVAEFAPRTEASAATLELRAPHPQWATGDPGSVAQILRIVVDNALQHSSNVAVTVDRLGDGPAVTVSDDGPGVAPHDAERIFERFQRGAESSSSGFGLGLAIGRELARRMGGDLVLVTSPRGARLRLWLAPADNESGARELREERPLV
jgi:signal transduction histidine kinase